VTPVPTTSHHRACARTMRSPSTGAAEVLSSACLRRCRPGIHPRRCLPVGGLRMARTFEHQPVMLDVVVDLFAAVPGGLVVDGTLGGGGHAAAILAAHPQLRVLGIDRDLDAIAAATERLAPFGDRATVHHGRFGQLGEVVDAAVPEPASEELSGVLLDLGVSSVQLDRAERGFSYRKAAPLDMRMDPSQGEDATDLVNRLSEQELTALFVANGEGRLARRIARAVVAPRPIATTDQLADVVAAAVPAAVRRRGHPASRVFQALRIEVNDELGELAAALPEGLRRLAPGGRFVVISYHSGEDRLVKAAFAEAVTGGCTCPPRLPCVCGAVPEHRLVFRGSHKPSATEVESNRRAQSARLRAAERLPVSSGVSR
jgi:16S rRNA (cytosine1402-N4)-methyltransferase